MSKSLRFVVLAASLFPSLAVASDDGSMFVPASNVICLSAADVAARA